MVNKIAIFCLVAVLFTTCKKSTDNGTEFFTPVTYKTQLPLSLPQYIILQQVQGYVYIPEGNKGSVVYHTPQGGFVVYDRTCSHDPEATCSAVTVDSNYIGLRCGSYNKGFKPCCGSIFDLSSGIAIQKPASRALKQYYTSYDEANKILYISTTPF